MSNLELISDQFSQFRQEMMTKIAAIEKRIAALESFSISVDDNIEEAYKPYLSQIINYYSYHHNPKPEIITNDMARKCFSSTDWNIPYFAQNISQEYTNAYEKYHTVLGTSACKKID